MNLLPSEVIEINQTKINHIDSVVRSIYRLIIYSRHHLEDDFLDTYLNSILNLKQQLAIKNAQMEAQNEEEAKEYLKNLQHSLAFIIEEINSNNNFEKELQHFQLLRLISPETNTIHPNCYRQTLVQIGSHICPDPIEVPGLVSELFHKMNFISNPIIKAIYLHHELIRIHPFADGNGRVTRIAKNWMIMFELYPPVYINDATEKKVYIETLSKSFKILSCSPNEWNQHTATFFKHELNRLLSNVNMLYNSVNKTGLKRAMKKSNHI